MLPPVNPPRHLSEAISTKLGPYTSLHSRSVQARAMLTSTRQIPATIANFAPDSDGYLWIKSDQRLTTASAKTWLRRKCSPMTYAAQGGWGVGGEIRAARLESSHIGRNAAVRTNKSRQAMALKASFSGVARRRTFICCLNVQISASSAARDRSSRRRSGRFSSTRRSVGARGLSVQVTDIRTLAGVFVGAA